MSGWHALVVLNTVLLILDAFRGDWIVRRLDRMERK